MASILNVDKVRATGSTTDGFTVNSNGSVSPGNLPCWDVWENGQQNNVQSNFVVNFSETRFIHDATLSNNRITPAVAGVYWVVATIRIDSLNLYNNSFIHLLKNGSIHQRGVEFVPNSSNAIYPKLYMQQSSFLVEVNGSSDYLQIGGTIGGGNNHNIGYNDVRFANHFQGFLVRAA